jgi:hypothetical protein
MKRILIIVIFVLSVLSLYTDNVYSWEEKITHRDISEIAAKNSILESSKGDYLKNLGYNGGLTEKFIWNNKSQSILLWLSDGSELEDAGTKLETVQNKSRSNNHFHNPMKPWESAGLDDIIKIPMLTPPYSIVDYPVYGDSALKWAQDPAKQAAFRSSQSEWDWSWQTVRQYYYLALIADSEYLKQEYFARTFRGVGHQMHLLQDMAVPTLSKNDINEVII